MGVEGGFFRLLEAPGLGASETSVSAREAFASDFVRRGFFGGGGASTSSISSSLSTEGGAFGAAFEEDFEAVFGGFLRDEVAKKGRTGALPLLAEGEMVIESEGYISSMSEDIAVC